MTLLPMLFDRSIHWTGGGGTHLSNHAVPLPVNVLPVPSVGHQVQVVGEAHNFGESLEDVDAEAFAAVLHGPGAVHHQAEDTVTTR